MAQNSIAASTTASTTCAASATKPVNAIDGAPTDLLFFDCPHCGGPIEVQRCDINCQIFRHGIFINGTQMNPHAPKEECDALAQNNQIYGCGRPFKLVAANNIWSAIVCEYI